MELQNTTSHFLRSSLGIVAAAGLFMGCADSVSLSPKGAGNSPAADIAQVELQAASDGRFPDLGSCTQLAAPAGSTITFRVFGIGVQVYNWDGAKWNFSNPEANLYANAGGNGLVGTHFSAPGAKPNWLTLSGSRVIGTVTNRCTPDLSAIAWLTLSADNSGTGVFQQTTLIQRLHTVGGLAPSTPGTVVGQQARVPYTADYYFYRTP